MADLLVHVGWLMIGMGIGLGCALLLRWAYRELAEIEGWRTCG